MRVVRVTSTNSNWPDPWQVAIIAICTLVLCSCRSNPMPQDAQANMPANPGQVSPTVPYGTATAAGYTTNCPDPGMGNSMPLPLQTQGYTATMSDKPGPDDEYLHDGGDKGLSATVNAHSQVLGLEMEDTVAEFKTSNGKTLVQPSNEVQIYSPRFGAVRQVVGAMENDERQKATGVQDLVKLRIPEHNQIVAGAKQNVQLVNEIGANPAGVLRTKQGDGALSNAIVPRGFQDRFKPFENLTIVRMGVYKEAEMAMLARGSNAAIAWTHEQSVQVFLDHQNVTADVKYDQAMSIYTVSTPPGKPKLQLVKLASASTAQPGDTVDFTLRFDNTGTDTLNSVVLVDSLNTRLEYVPDSAQCTVEAQFSVMPNEGDSVVLRCELKQPLKPGEGGIVRFRCRVR